MERVSASSNGLEYETTGSGEPLVLIHGSIIGDAYSPLLREDSLTSHYQVTNYHRRGFLDSPRHDGPFSIEDQVADALAVLRAVAGRRAHIAGHSYGGVIALQLALTEPDAVATISLFEPPLPVPSAEGFFAALPPIDALFAAGDKAGATDAFLSLAVGDGYREAADRTLGAGWFERAVADIDTFFKVEVPALNEWTITADAAARIEKPVLSVVGGDSPEFFQEGHALIQEWLPQAESLVVPGATHGLQIQNPRAVAEGLAAFLARHSMMAGVA
jgi:pimeloyl-ACP methyl ester carboxylesterase